MTRGEIGPSLFRLAAAVLAAFAFGAGTARSQCTQSGTILQFEPNPPGVSRPGTLSSGFNNSLALYGTSGGPRMLMIESWGYSTLDLTNPGSPTALKYDDMRLDPNSGETNTVEANGDSQYYVQTIGISPDGQRIVTSMTGPAEPVWHNLVGRPDGGEGFGMWGDFGDSRASGTVVLESGARYVSFATYFSSPVIVSDVSTLTTDHAQFLSLNLASETTGLPPGDALSTAGNYVLYLKTAATGVQIIDASSPGPAGAIASGFKTATLASVPGDPYARVPKNYAAAVDPADPTKLWVLVELQAWAPAGENSPSYGLVSISRDGNGDFQPPVSAGALFRVPSSAGEVWSLSGSSASLVASNGQLFAIMWAKRQSPSQQFVPFTSSAQAWAPVATSVSVPVGFDLTASSAAVLAGAGTSVYQYIPTGARAFVVPYTCQAGPPTIRIWVNNQDPCPAGSPCVENAVNAQVGDTLTAWSYLNGDVDSPAVVLSWNFPGATPQSPNGQGATFAYTAAGTYDLNLTRNGVSYTFPKAAVITPSTTPLSALATATPTVVDMGAPVLFKCTAAGGGGANVFAWLFSDGATAAGPIVFHNFASFGAASGTCTVTDFVWATASSRADVTVLAPGSGGPYSMFVLNPCRLLDTRNPAGPMGGPAIQPTGTSDRAFVLGSYCGIPYDAKAISANVTVANVQATGTVSVYRGDGERTGANTIAVKAGVTRANNSMLQLALDASGTIKIENRTAGTLDLILDVNGYFR